MSLLEHCKSTTCPMSEDLKLSSDFSINSKSTTRFNCKSMKIIKRGRLSGGADANEANITESVPKNTAKSTSTLPMESPVETVAEPSIDSSVKLPTNTSDFASQQIDHTSGPCCLCATHLSGATGDDKVNEIIDFAHQNLQDAGKALATLEENFEHGLKLAIADVQGRIQQWSSTVQNKLDTCKGDIENLRKELLSRICDINDKERKIADLNAQITDLLSQIDQLKQEIAECSATKTNLEKLLADKAAEPPPVPKENPAPKPETIVTEPIVEPPPPPPPPPPKTEVVKTTDDSIMKKPIEKPKKNDECKRLLEQTREKDRERKRRESELEAEIARLRKENEKIMKERIDYENAIQRALLRGVSSLNVEALRVLRCPPIPCCSPCVPCPMSLGATAEQTVPCPVKAKRTNTARATNKVCGRSSGNGKNNKHDQCDFMIKQPCGSPCCPAEKSQLASDNSMFFLLHQGDTENVCGANEIPSPRPCGSPIMKKIEISPCPRFARP